MATTASKPRHYAGHEQDLPLTRGARVGLLALIVLTILFASGVLFIRYQLDAFRGEVARRIEQRFGARLTMGAISVNGLRGLRIQNLDLELPLEHGPVLRIDTESALINIQLNDLLYGNVTVDRLALDRATITLERPESATWYSEKQLKLDELVPFEVSHTAPFRITGSECRFVVKNVVADTQFVVSEVAFDISRLVDAANLTATVRGNFQGDRNKFVDANLNFTSVENFNLDVRTSLITPEDVDVFLPADRNLITEGQAHPTLWVNGRPGRVLLATLQTPFENVVVRDQPEFLEPASGTITVFATYAADSRQLNVTMAKADSNQLDGDVEGSIIFSEAHPEFDLRLHARRIPIMEILNYSLEGEMEDIGRMDLLLDEPHELEVSLTGNSDEPIIRGQTRSAAGRFQFEPKPDENLPPIQLALRQIEGAWDSYTQKFSLAFDVADGEVEIEPLQITAKGLQGHVTINDNIVSLTPMNAQYKGNTIVGEGEYDLSTGDGRLKFDGTIASLDETVVGDQFKDTRIAGAVSLKGEATRKDKKVVIEADLDATQADVSYQWWLRKSAGLGASGHVRAEISNNSTAHLTAVGQVASSTIETTVTISRGKNKQDKWQLASMRATSDHVDVNTIAKCALVPYRTTGGIASAAYFEFERDPADPLIHRQRFGAKVDDLALLPEVEGATIPVSGRGVIASFELVTDKGNRTGATGYARIDADAVTVPPFGTTWLIPLQPPPEWPRVYRAWDLDLRAKDADVPPWKGKELVAHAFSTRERSGFSPYEAKIGDGTISGTYVLTRLDNTYESSVDWTGVPVHYFLDHLKLPEVLDGTITGKVRYTVDRDDPNTLDGFGHFDVVDGRFSADFLYELIEGSANTEITSIPPKLDFKLLAADVHFLKDTVETPMITLDSDSIRLDGTGHYIRDGDMDYSVKVAVEPDTAAQIPLMASNFNIQGHRLSNTPIELTFHVGGPTFNPRGQVEELPPASVTLVSGALEVGREAVNLIDFPRKILVDLLKIGGGVVRGGRNN